MKKSKSISSFGFSTSYTTIPHKLLLKVFSEVIDLILKSKVRKCIGVSKTSIHLSSNGAGRIFLTRQTLSNAKSFFTNKCFFTIRSVVFKQDIGLPMGINPEMGINFYPTTFFYIFESKYVKQLISNGSSQPYKYHEASRFIDYLCTINDGDKSLTSFKNIYLRAQS